MGIFVAAMLVTAFSVWIGRVLLKNWTGHERIYYYVLVGSIVLSPVVNYVVKKPALAYMLSRSHVSPRLPEWPWWFVVLSLLLVGISEEAIKLVPLLVSSVRSAVRARRSAVPMAFAIGLGFALGEIWFLAYRIHVNVPAIASLPFYMLAGFMSERFATVIIHSFLVLLPLRGLLGGTRRFLQGTASAMIVHALIDVTAMLYQMKLVGAGVAGVVLIAITVACVRPFSAYREKLTASDRSDVLVRGTRLLYMSDSRETGCPENPVV